MQSRLEEYDRKGIAASVEMQRVAQAVNVQNQRLRRLLVMHGVSEPEIERYLSSLEGDHAVSNSRRRCNTCGHFAPGLSQTRAILTDDPLRRLSEPASLVAKEAVPTLISAPSNSILPTPSREQPSFTEPPTVSIQTRKEDDGISMLEEEEPGLHHPIHKGTRTNHKAPDSLPAQREMLSDTFEPSNSRIHSFGHPEPLETPCDKAAEILVELRGHADSSWARVALGCYGVGSCSVKNTEIFRLMDDID
ncbi:hypothetical protein NW766_011896 [Fusarium irregulare]|uniref:Uncharacterized protein n=1 Tax=Fusarium irregulare TaxID=2494466 RepID=A0A9W8PF71_9HYPO|nr:hypothetical protein NW766_011896 [Fusarium irregulare]